jgi:hypothetical protein
MSRAEFVARESEIFYKANLYVLCVNQIEGFVADFEREYCLTEVAYEGYMLASPDGVAVHMEHTKKMLQDMALMQTVLLPILGISPNNLPVRSKAVQIMGYCIASVYSMELGLV